MSELEIKEAEEQNPIVDEDAEPLENGEAEDSDDEVLDNVVSFGDEKPEDEPTEQAPEFIKELRKKSRADNKRIKELEKKLEGKTEDEQPLGARPKLESFDYDEDKHEEALIEWIGKKREGETKAKAKLDEQEQNNANWETRKSEYIEGQSDFNEDEYADANDVVRNSFNDAQDTIMVHVLGKNAAKVVMGLGNNDAELKRVSKITDQFLFAAEIAKLEAKMTVTKRKPKHAPEEKVGGSASHDGGSRNLDKLKDQARASGDYTAYYDAKNRKKE